MSSLLKLLGIDQLSVDDRIQLVQEIWDSITPLTEEAPLTEAQKQELGRRLADHEKHPERVLSWEVVKARVQAKLRGSVVRYDRPTEPVAEDDWEAQQ